MNDDAALALRLRQFTQSWLKRTIEACPEELFTKTIRGSLTNPIGVLYAHGVFEEDIILGWLTDSPTVFETGEWRERIGVDLPDNFTISDDWISGFAIKKKSFQEYADAVFAATDSYVSTAEAADLAKEHTWGPRDFPALETLTIVGTHHVASHQGEIAALMGLEGLKGQPV